MAALGLAGCRHSAPEAASGGEEQTEAPPVTVQVAAVTVQPMETTVSAQGTLSPGQGASARVAPAVAGRLLTVRVREGDRVQAGQVVATLENRPQQAQARSAAAAVGAAQAQERGAGLAAQAGAIDQSNAVQQARLALVAARTDRDNAVQQAQIALRQAQADLRRTQAEGKPQEQAGLVQQAQLALEAARLDRDNAVKQAQIALRQAETDLQKTQAGARPQEIAQADQAVKQAQTTRDRAATEVERVQTLFDDGIAPRRQVDDAKTALAVAEAALESARQQAALLRAGARPEELQAGQLHVEDARAALDAAQTSGAAKVTQAEAALQQAQQGAARVGAQTPEELNAAQLKVNSARADLLAAQTGGAAKVAQAAAALRQAQAGTLQVAVKRQDMEAMRAATQAKRADLAAAQASAAYAVIRAPASGVVIRRTLNPGDMADPAAPMLEIADARSLNLLAALPAADGLKVRPGLAARITAPDLPGHVFTGRVLSVGDVDPQTNLLTVRLAVFNAGGSLKAGAFATAQIVLSSRPTATVVPKAAVISRDGQPVVFTVGPDGAAHQHAVALGAQRDGVIEVVRGARPGERVIRLGQYELEDGAKVNVAPN